MTPAGNLYGEALYTLALEDGLSTPVLQELAVLQESFSASPEFIRLLSSPGLSKQERCAILDESFQGRLQPYVLNFLKLMTEQGCIRHFDEACRAYTRLYNRENGILPVTAVTALPLSPDQRSRLQDKLAAMTGKTITLTNRLEPACMGGIRLEYDGLCVDDTIAHRLESIGKTIQNTVI